MTDAAFREHKIEANGLTHYVQDWGDENAPPVLLLHGFPDSSALWRHMAPRLAAGGYRVIVPDLRGYGATDAPPSADAYKIPVDIAGDILEILSALNIQNPHLAGHDFGAMTAWYMAARYGKKFKSLTAISVGHPNSYMNAGFRQKISGAYLLLHSMNGFCEAFYRFANWHFFRRFTAHHCDLDAVITELSRPGRLTAALNWYRANLPAARFFDFIRTPRSSVEKSAASDNAPKYKNPVSIPTMGIWSSNDHALLEPQMVNTAPYINAPWRYERIDGPGHWVPLEAPEKVAALFLDHWGKVDQNAY